MRRVWLIRHGASVVPAGIAIGATDPPLSELGRAQAMQVADRLHDRPLSAVWSSDSVRARDTAWPVAEPHRVAVQTTPALREIDFGTWEGRLLGDLWQEDPEAARAWESDLRRTPPAFGETVTQLERRVAQFWSDLEPWSRGGEVAVVAHRGSLAALRAVITRCSFVSAFASPMDLGAAEAVDL
jgi:broad specificity phosphatase PhoE